MMGSPLACRLRRVAHEPRTHRIAHGDHQHWDGDLRDREQKDCIVAVQWHFFATPLISIP
jgi:hypothetical protein